jgi:hypothetical protein
MVCRLHFKLDAAPWAVRMPQAENSSNSASPLRDGSSSLRENIRPGQGNSAAKDSLVYAEVGVR